MEKYIIYMHKNLINGKVYIGQTHLSPERRFRGGAGYVSSPHFYRAIEKYGWDNFEHIILEKDLDSEQADLREKFWIQVLDSTNRKKGYNIKVGGHGEHNIGPSPNRVEVYCKETGEKFESLTAAALWLGKKPEFASNISANAKGKKTSAGKHPETGESLHWCFTKEEINTPNKVLKKPGAKQVMNLETEEIFSSVNEAARIYGISNVTISKSCKSEGKIATGYNNGEKFHWVFVD